MSEYQYVAFRAIDGPVSGEDLEFMRAQSSRAEVSPWSFANEYHYGDFRGDALEMLRRGYDIHLHYANFGIRRVLIRFPNGLPDVSKPYFSADGVRCLRDKKGPGRTLRIGPFHEPGTLEELFDVGDVLDSLVPLRAEILDGDLRPLYLAHLAMASDGNHDPDATKEAPVPAGLAKLTEAQHALARLYDLSAALIAAAAEGNPSPAPQGDPAGQLDDWIRSQPSKTKDGWLSQWLSDAGPGVRQQVLAKFRASQAVPAWPTVRLGRTIAELQTAADGIQQKMDRKAQEDAARQRAKELAKMAADPTATLRKTEELAKRRTTESYSQLARLLADLREALAGSEQAHLAEQQAKKLKDKNPKLSRLPAALRGRAVAEVNTT